MNDRRTLALGELGVVIGGSTPSHKHPEQFGDRVPFITPTDIETERKYVDTSRFLSDVGAQAHRKRLLEANAVCFVCIGSTIGKTCMTRELSMTNQQINAVVVDPGIADPEYVYYALRLQADNIRATASGSATPILNKSAFSAITLSIPALAVQQAVGAVLASLDAKIESNLRLARLIPQLIAVHVAKATSDGSESISVANLARFVNGGAYTNGATGRGRMVLRIAELNSGPGRSTVYNELDVPDDKVARPGDLLMSWSGSLGVYRWARAEAIINQHIFKVLPGDYPAWLVHDRLNWVLPIFRAIAKDKATTMGHIQRGHLESTVVTVPLPPAIAELDHVMGPLWNRLSLAEAESVRLSELRDTLAPALLAGRLQISQPRETAGAAA